MAANSRAMIEVRPDGIRLLLATPLPMPVGGRVSVTFVAAAPEPAKAAKQKDAGDGAQKPSKAKAAKPAKPAKVAKAAKTTSSARAATPAVPGRFIRNFDSQWVEFAGAVMPAAIAAFGSENGSKLEVAVDTTDPLPVELALQAVAFLGAAAGLVEPLGEVARSVALVEMVGRAQRDHVRKIARALLCWGTCLSFATPEDWSRAAAGAVAGQPGADILRDVAKALTGNDDAVTSAVEAGDGLIAGAVALRDASEATAFEEFAERATFGARELLHALRAWESFLPRRRVRPSY